MKVKCAIHRWKNILILSVSNWLRITVLMRLCFAGLKSEKCVIPGWLNFMYILIHINAGTGFLHQGQSGADMWEKIHWKENDVLQKNLVPAALICAGQKDIIIKTILILPENLVSLIYIQQKEEWTFPKMAHWKLDESVLRNVSTPDGWNDAFLLHHFLFLFLTGSSQRPQTTQ